MEHEIELPDLVRTAVAAQGARGAAWVRELPTIVSDLERRWDVTLGSTMSGGTSAFVAEATTSAGESVVLKVALPMAIDGPDAFANRVTTFRIAEGRGMARLLAHDDAHKAMLLERLGPDVSSLGLPVRRQLEIIGETVRQLWVPVPDDTRLPFGDDKARWLAEFIERVWDEVGRPCARRTIEIALDHAASRASEFDSSRAVLVHGDAHSWNTLQAADGSFKLIDPEGLASEPAHDLAIPMRDMHDDLLAGDAYQRGRDRAAYLGALTGVDPEAVWQWGFVERVSSGLYSLQLGMEMGRDFLVVADLWAAAS